MPCLLFWEGEVLDFGPCDHSAGTLIPDCAAGGQEGNPHPTFRLVQRIHRFSHGVGSLVVPDKVLLEGGCASW
jgi:hypothetical protein